MGKSNTRAKLSSLPVMDPPKAIVGVKKSRSLPPPSPPIKYKSGTVEKLETKAQHQMLPEIVSCPPSSNKCNIEVGEVVSKNECSDSKGNSRSSRIMAQIKQVDKSHTSRSIVGLPLTIGGRLPGSHRISLKTHTPTVKMGETIWVYFDRTDLDQDICMWDFLAVHRKGETCDLYQASRYMHRPAKGRLNFVAPSEPGVYQISAVRDIKYICRLLTSRVKLRKDIQGHGSYEEMKAKLETHKGWVIMNEEEHLVMLDTVLVEVSNEEWQQATDKIVPS